jgi:hypothetical protein
MSVRGGAWSLRERGVVFARESKAGIHQVRSVSAYEPILSVQLRDRRAAWRVREYEGQPDKGCMGRCILAAWIECRITLAGLPWEQVASWLVELWGSRMVGVVYLSCR